jgi:hypothetical protein
MKAIVDTTVMTDALLKADAQKDRAVAALARYDETLLPVYAIKEFKAGPLHYYVWCHNKAVEADSVAEVVNAIRSNMIFKKNLPATALNAIENFHDSIGQQLPGDIQTRYPGMTLQHAMIIELRLWLRQKITRAWRRRRTSFSAVISPLSCYPEADLVLKNSGQLEDGPRDCPKDDCCQRQKYSGRSADLKLLEDACVGTKQEVVRRRQALKRLLKHPKAAYERKHCKALGDAIFTLECRAGAEILTTNLVDHKPLADALGFIVRSP